MTVVYATILLLVLLWAFAAWQVGYSQQSRIFPCDGAPFDAPYPQLERLGSQRFQVEREGQSLRWHEIPAQGNVENGSLIVFHGNRGGAAERFDYARHLCPLGWRMVLAEFPGYAGGGGGLGEWHFLRNALALYDEIRERNVGKKLIVFGESLGSGAATYCAYKRSPGALLLHTPYPSMTAVAKARFPMLPIYTMMKHPIEAQLWAPHVKCPVYIVHGSKDVTIPYRVGMRQAANFKQARVVTIEGAGHGNLREFDAPKYWGEMKRFIEGLA